MSTLSELRSRATVPSWFTAEYGKLTPEQWKKFKPLDRQPIVARLIVSGVTSYREIAELLHVSRGSILKDVEKVREEWKGEYTEVYQNMLSVQAQRLGFIIREQFDAWEKSKTLDTEDVVNRESGGGEGADKTRVTKKKKPTSGDTSHMALALEAVKHLSKIAGLDVQRSVSTSITASVEQKTTVTTENGTKLQVSERVEAIFESIRYASDSDLNEAIAALEGKNASRPKPQAGEMFDPEKIGMPPAPELLPGELDDHSADGLID